MYDPDHFRLEGQVAIVTGGGAGIGRAIARTFAGAGAAVVVSDLRPDDADEAANEIQRSGGRAVAVACDVTEPDDLARLVDTANERFGSLTTLVSNAGGGGPKPFDMDMADFRRAYDCLLYTSGRLHRGGHAPRRRWLGGALRRVRRGPHDRPGHGAPHHRRDQVHRARRHRGSGS